MHKFCVNSCCSTVLTGGVLVPVDFDINMARDTAQMEALVGFLEENVDIARGLTRTIQGRQDAKRKWHTLSLLVNPLGTMQKDGPGWAKYWSERKSYLKKITAQRALAMRSTGRGREHLPALSPLDERAIAILGGESFALGNRRLAVEPFPQRSQSQPATASSAPTQSQPATATPVVPIEVVQEILVQPEEVENNLAWQIHRPLEELIQESPAQVSAPTVRRQTPLLSEQGPPEPVLVIPEPQGQQQEVPAANAPATRAPTRPSTSTRSQLTSEVDRFASIEQRRVEAELKTAQALGDIAAGLKQSAEAIQEVANAIKEAGTDVRAGLNEIARSLRPRE